MQNSEHSNPLDAFSIDLTRAFDRVYWGRKLQATVEQLADAIQAVGPNAMQVGNYVELQRSERQEAAV